MTAEGTVRSLIDEDRSGMRSDVRSYVAQPGPSPWDDHTLLTIARERAGYLADAGRQVSGSPNLPATVRQALRACVPQLADWAQIMHVESVDLIENVDHLSYASVAVEGDLLTARMPDTQLPRILATGRSELLHVDAAGLEPDGLTALVPDDAMRLQVSKLRPADLLGVPLSARGTTFGSLTLARPAGYGFSEEDVSLAEELAARVAPALDAARRYTESSSIASVLQASLRPPRMPVRRGVHLAARYRPAVGGVDLGGDFYDVWGTDDEWSVVLGAGSGKGIEAAVVTGQARHTVRGAAAVDRHPSAVLRALNGLLFDDQAAGPAGRSERPGRHVTALYGRVRPLDAGGLLVELASAGHPAPLVIRADGTASQIPVRGLAAGLVADTLYRAATVRLAPGDTLLLYTDGVTEAGDHNLRAGTNRLTALAASYAGAHLDAIVEAVERDVLERAEHGHRDDLAVLAVLAVQAAMTS